MNTYSIQIDPFEGPMDMLLQLVEKNKINIYEVQISEVIDQYLDQIRAWEEADMTVESEFILMASRLIEIKSRKLLPKLIFTEEEDDEALLLQQLALYGQFRKVAELLRQKLEHTGKLLYKDPEYLPRIKKKELDPIDPMWLHKAYKRLEEHKESHDELVVHKKIFKSFYSVRDKVWEIQTLLEKSDRDKVLFSDIIRNYRDYREVLAGFLALLELIKTNIIEVYQESIFTDIEIQIKNDDAN